jgi:hypothetical protein
MVIERNTPEMKPERKAFVGNRGYPELKGISVERLEAWIRFMESDLFVYLVNVFRKRRADWIGILIEPSRLRSACEELGVNENYWQGAYMEDGVLEDVFEMIKNEFDVRTKSATGDANARQRQPESPDLLDVRGAGFPGNDAGRRRSRFDYKNPR